MNNDDDDFVADHVGMVYAIVMGGLVGVGICLVLVYFKGLP